MSKTELNLIIEYLEDGKYEEKREEYLQARVCLTMERRNPIPAIKILEAELKGLENSIVERSHRPRSLHDDSKLAIYTRNRLKGWIKLLERLR